MIASSFARTIQCVLCNPLVVIKTRLEVVGFNEYTGMTHAFKHIWKNEGPRGFMIGAWLSLIRDVPASAVFYPIYKGFRNFFSFLLVDPNHHHSQEFNKMAVTTLASWFANVFGCIITHPIDLIRTRVYFKRFNKD
jgi:solute carrier family 25 protein 38